MLQVLVKLGQQARGGVLLEPEELTGSKEEKLESEPDVCDIILRRSRETHLSTRVSVKFLPLWSLM